MCGSGDPSVSVCADRELATGLEQIIAKHNTVSKELWTIQDRRTSPLPSSSATSTGAASGSQVPTLSQSGARPASQDRPGMDGRKASGVKTDPNYEDYLALVKEVQALRVSLAWALRSLNHQRAQADD